MATTSPDSLYYPVSTDQIAPLETVFANVQSSTQTALNNRAQYNFVWPSAAAQTAQSNMRIGDSGVRTDTMTEYLYYGATLGWLPQGGLVAWTPVLGGATTNPSVGSTGTSQGYYLLQGKLCTVVETFVFNGTGTSSGSGVYTMSLPFAASTGMAYQGANGIADKSGASDPGASHGVVQGVIVGGASVISGLRLGDGTRVSSALAWSVAGSYFAMQYTYVIA